MKTTGHWFCNACNDVVFLPVPWGRWDTRRGALCRVCHHPAADWVPDTSATTPQPMPENLNPVTAAKLFARLKQSVE